MRPIDGRNTLRIIWVHPGFLFRELSAATYLDTTHELREQGCNVTLITPGPAGTQQIRGVDVLCLSRPDIFFIRQMVFHLKAVIYVLRHWHEADVVLFRELSTPWILPLRLLRPLFRGRSRRPLFVCDTRSMHMPNPETSSLRVRLRGLYLGLMLRAANRWSDGRTTITKHMGEEVGIPASKLWGIWASGVDPKLFASAQTRRRWPQHDEPVRIVYVGSLEPERRLLPFAQAVERANAAGMSFQLTLVGAGFQRDELRQFAAGTSGRVCVLDAVPHEQVPDILAEAHVGVLPFPDEPKWRVSSPVKLFEYMAAGMPILATRIVCHTDVIGDGKFVFWSAPEDYGAALRQLWQARATLAEAGRQAETGVAGWTWHNSAAHLKAALEYGLATHA